MRRNYRCLLGQSAHKTYPLTTQIRVTTKHIKTLINMRQMRIARLGLPCRVRMAATSRNLLRQTLRNFSEVT